MKTPDQFNNGRKDWKTPIGEVPILSLEEIEREKEESRSFLRSISMHKTILSGCSAFTYGV
jgi:hypothetical protein